MAFLSFLLSFPASLSLTRWAHLKHRVLRRVLSWESQGQPGERWCVLKDKPPSSGTCKPELGTHLSHSDLEVNRVAAPSEIGFSSAEGVGVDLLGVG